MRHRFSFRTYRRPLRVALRTAHGVWAERQGVLLRVESPGGQVGWGEIAPIPWFGTETLAEAEEFCRGLNGEWEDGQLPEVPARLGCVRFALAAATTPAPPKSEARRLPVAALLPAGKAALAELPPKLEAGYLAFKWKVGVARAEEELPVLDDLLAQLPAYAKLRLDANGAWDRRTAERWLAHAAGRPIEFIEQPAAPDDRDLLLGLAHDYPVPLALDESVTHLAAAREWQQLGWRGVYVLKPALAGPLAELVAWAQATKPDLVLSSAIETAVGRAQFLRTAFAANMTTRALGVGVGELFGSRVWDGPATGPLLDAAWCDAVNPEALWNELS